jgi:hypothetical protein
MIMESLTLKPGIREHNPGAKQAIGKAIPMSAD